MMIEGFWLVSRRLCLSCTVGVAGHGVEGFEWRCRYGNIRVSIFKKVLQTLGIALKVCRVMSRRR